MSEQAPTTSTDEKQLKQAEAEGGSTRWKTYAKLSGPGWIQSAITLGGGSLAGGLFLGVIGGYSLLWVQLTAIVLGVTMLSAIAYVTLSIESSPFHGIRKHINPVLAWGWLLASLAANMVWALPQYSLANAALTDNIFPNLDGDSNGVIWTINLLVLAFVTAITFAYGREGKGVRVYETIIKIIVALIVLSFMGVVLRLTVGGNLPWGEILLGFVPNFSLIFQPSAEYQAIISQIPNEAARAFWTELVVSAQQDRMVAAAATAVGINMTFLLPFSMLAKKWNRNFRGFAVFDLSTGLVIPYLLAVSCVVIAAASQFHGQPYEGLLDGEPGSYTINADSGRAGALNALLAQRDAVVAGGQATTLPHDQQEILLGAMMQPRDTKELAPALETLFGSELVAQKVFGFGVLAMALSTISVLMLISGFCICEILKRPYHGWTFRLGTLCAATGILWPFLWAGQSRAYLAIPTSVIGYTLIPIAFITFFLMMNSRPLLGDAMPRGGKRWLWNILMGVAVLITGTAAIATGWGKSFTFEEPSAFAVSFWTGIRLGYFDDAGVFNARFGALFIILFVTAVIIGQIYMAMKNKQKL